MASATSRPTTIERGENPRMCGGFCGPGDDMRRIVCALDPRAASGFGLRGLFRRFACRPRAPGDEPRHGGLVAGEASCPRGAPLRRPDDVALGEGVDHGRM